MSRASAPLVGRRSGERRAAGTDSHPAGPIGVVAAVIMLFSAFAAAILVRRGDPDWVASPVPGVAWGSGGLLLLSCLVVGRAAGLAGSGRPPAASLEARRWIGAAIALAVLFLAGQAASLVMLAGGEVTPAGGPFGAFYFTLTAVHGLLVLGGVGALGHLLGRVPGRPLRVPGRPLRVPGRPLRVPGRGRERRDVLPLGRRAWRPALSGIALYWYALAGVWLAVLALLASG